jgi:hypothetical protein
MNLRAPIRMIHRRARGDRRDSKLGNPGSGVQTLGVGRGDAGDKAQRSLFLRVLYVFRGETELVRALALGVVLTLMGLVVGCGDAEKPAVSPQPYVDQGYKPDLPYYMHGTVYERTDMGNTDPFPVTGYSLIVNLQNTGDNSGIPTVVREAMIKKMALAGFGQHEDQQLAHLQPEQVLRDKRVAIVQVIGMLPVGVRQGQHFDVTVRAMPRSRTSSLAHGHLYNTELRQRGLEEPSGGGTILAYADAGDVFVNPAYALEGVEGIYSGTSKMQVSASLRNGTILNAGRATTDRPIFLQLRIPQASISRAIEARVNNRFQQQEDDRPAAAAQDEGLVELYVPYNFNGDWKHFTQVVNHLYLNDSVDVAAQKTRMLMAAAHKSGANLTDISYCLEGLGPSVLPIYESMMSDSDPGIAFAAARAAVFCNDPNAVDTLLQMASNPGHPYQLAAVHTLGELPPSQLVASRLEPLLGSDQTLVRIEAYKILAASGERRIVTEELPGKFKVDVVDYPGAPLIFASRTGEPRLAIFGQSTAVAPPVVFAAMHDRFTISSDDLGTYLTLFYRDPRRRDPVQLRSGLMLAEVVTRLGGKSLEDEDQLDLSYSDVVAILEGMTDSHYITAANTAGKAAEAAFVLDRPAVEGDVLAAASLDARPQGDPINPPRRQGSAGDAPASSDTGASISGEVPSFDQPPSANGAGASHSVPDFGNP